VPERRGLLTTIDRPQIGAPDRLSTAETDVVVVGGAGHVGLPLSLALAQAGLRVGIVDTSAAALAYIERSEAPFVEPGIQPLLDTFVNSDSLWLSSSADTVHGADAVIVAVNVPQDELVSSVTALDETIDGLAPYLAYGTLLVLRNTVYPGTTAHVSDELRGRGLAIDVVFCPERIVEGRALEELRTLPQIVGADDEVAAARAAALFGRLGVEIVHCTPMEAEIAKLVANAWRYLTFAAANQFWTLTEESGVDYANVLRVVRYDYPRAQGLPGPGFAGGPCLVKDAAALADFAGANGALLRAAIEVNEELPARVIRQMDQRFGSLAGRSVGLLGMTFKAESDDTRGAHSIRLRELLERAGAHVLCTDPYVRDDSLLPLAYVLARAEIVVIGTPHRAYRQLDVAETRLVDIWGIANTGIVP
jgi:UDP-N-acetyl-D-mannosaminuronic acid dehydrogenase